MAVEILFDAIKEYAYPLIEACGLHLDPYGYIVDNSNKKLCFKNPKFVEGDDVSVISPVLYPMVPLKDSDYLEIKNQMDVDLFNPFTNIKHIILIAIKLKHLAAVDLNPELLKTAIDEDDWNKFDDYIGLSNDINSMGQIDYALVDLSLPEKPEILRYVCPADEPVKGLWALCVEMFNRYISQRPPYLKQFQDIDKSWKKIQTAMRKWDKLRKEIVSEIRKENNQNMNIEYMDLSETITPGEAINVFTMAKPLTADDFLRCNDGGDINDPVLQDFLTSLFNKDSLKPYVEKEQPVVKEEPKEIKEVVEPQQLQPLISEKEDTNRIFKKTQSNQTLSFNNPGMYGNMFQNTNPMMGGMNGYGMPQPMKTSMNIDDLCLGDVINPFANYT